MTCRVGILVTSYSREIGLAAGGHVHFIEVAKRWHDVELNVFAPREAEDELRKALPAARFIAIPEIAMPHWRLSRLARMFGGLKLRGELRRMDAILATSHFIADVIPAVWARPSRTIVTLHHLLGIPGKRSGPFFSNLLAWCSQLVSLTVARVFVNRFVFDCRYVAENAKFFVGHARWFVSTNGVSVGGEPLLEKSGCRDAIYLGRLDPLKRVEDAILAWARLTERTTAEHRLHIAGDGAPEYRDKLVSLVSRLNLQDSVIFHGRVDDAKKWQLLRQSALYVFPSSEEGWGISIAEAMWAGLPCVTYDLPVFADVFPRGRLEAPLKDVGALAELCEMVLSQHETREKLSMEAAALARTFVWERAAAIEREALNF